jgi:hypothetical protein
LWGLPGADIQKVTGELAVEDASNAIARESSDGEIVECNFKIMTGEVIRTCKVDIDGKVQRCYGWLCAEDIDLLKANITGSLVIVDFVHLLTDDTWRVIVIISDEVD